MQSLTNSTRLETVRRALEKDSFSVGPYVFGGRREINEFDAVVDYDKSTSAGIAGLFSLVTVGTSVLLYKLFHFAQSNDKQSDLAVILTEVLINHPNENRSEIDGKFIIEEINNEVKVNSLTDPTDFFILDSRKAPGQRRNLAQLREQLTASTLSYPNISNNEQVRLLKQKVALSQIQVSLSPNAEIAFQRLFNIEEVGKVDPSSPLVSGDLDGSVARQIVLGIQAGIITIDPTGIGLLINLLNAEGDVLAFINDSKCTKNAQDDVLREFQGNKAIQDEIAELAEHLSFDYGHTTLIYIGDTAHDRFSCNKDVERIIREKMVDKETIFIRGNHDVYDSRNKEHSAEFGGFAKDTASSQEWADHEALVFCNSYFDKNANTLYLHHGIGLNAEERTIITAFGEYSISADNVFNPTDFVNAINDMPLPLSEDLFEAELEKAIQEAADTVEGVDRKLGAQLRLANATDHKTLTSFRPTRNDPTVMNQIAELLGIRIVHGHDGLMNLEQTHTLALNSRVGKSRREGKFTSVAVRIGEYRASVPDYI